ncbi:MAG: hypothetical protein KUG75_03765 [Pseudomonadales bacterium]|nr:hypothetical protein [Pseudomonadales bacterium]
MNTHNIEQEISERVAHLAPKLLQALEALAFTARHLHPPTLAELAATLTPHYGALKESRNRFIEITWPENLAIYQNQLTVCADHTLSAIQGMEKAALKSNGLMQAFASLRKTTLAVEALYPISVMLTPVSQFFLEPKFRDDASLLQLLSNANANRDLVGIKHTSNSRDIRGGISIYVPEYYDKKKQWPLVVALHGGSGHGADSLWTWLREARSRGFIVLSPTSIGNTWSLMGEDHNAETLRRIVADSCEQWNIDTQHILLTGMSDGATYSLLQGLPEATPFTHLAPVSGTFHPMLLDGIASIEKKPIYLVHGALDWMFPVSTARLARDYLSESGADVVYRELDDLSHTYPREENTHILDWFLS